jgi:hypothetical protein
MNDYCEIVVRGHLDRDWSEWFEGLTIMHNDKGETILSGHIRDQAVLYSILAKARDLGLFLISVTCIPGKFTEENGNSDDPS